MLNPVAAAGAGIELVAPSVLAFAKIRKPFMS